MDFIYLGKKQRVGHSLKSLTLWLKSLLKSDISNPYFHSLRGGGREGGERRGGGREGGERRGGGREGGERRGGGREGGVGEEEEGACKATIVDRYNKKILFLNAIFSAGISCHGN